MEILQINLNAKNVMVQKEMLRLMKLIIQKFLKYNLIDHNKNQISWYGNVYLVVMKEITLIGQIVMNVMQIKEMPKIIKVWRQKSGNANYVILREILQINLNALNVIIRKEILKSMKLIIQKFLNMIKNLKILKFRIFPMSCIKKLNLKLILRNWKNIIKKKIMK